MAAREGWCAEWRWDRTARRPGERGAADAGVALLPPGRCCDLLDRRDDREAVSAKSTRYPDFFRHVDLGELRDRAVRRGSAASCATRWLVALCPPWRQWDRQRWRLRHHAYPVRRVPDGACHRVRICCRCLAVSFRCSSCCSARLIDSLAGLVLSTSPSGPFATWMLIGYMRSIPTELDEAARIDGAGRSQILLRVLVPWPRPASPRGTVRLHSGLE